MSVDAVRPDSPGAAVTRAGDLILSLAGRPVADADDFVRRVGATPPDRSVPLSIRRGGTTISTAVTLVRRRTPVAAVTRATQRLRWGGMLLTSLDADRGPGLAVAHVDPSSPFARFGVRDGSVLRTVAGRPVRSIVELQDVINDVPLPQCALGTSDPVAGETASIRE